MSKHTTGPWEVGIALLVAKQMPDGTARRICECVIGPEAEANAHLIAAAPDLLALLTDLKFWFETNKRTGSIMYPRICDGIAKAEGQS